MNKLLNFAVLAVALGSAAAVHAVASPGYSSTGNTGPYAGEAVTVGFSFTALSDVYVTALGYNDSGVPGLASSHAVGLFALSDGSALRTVDVQAGTASTFIDGYRYEGISQYRLHAGTQYVLAAYANGADGYLVPGSAASLTSHPLIAIGATGLYLYGHDTLMFPTVCSSKYAYYPTANLLLSPVPEPASYALMLAGLAALFGVSQARRSKA